MTDAAQVGGTVRRRLRVLVLALLALAGLSPLAGCAGVELAALPAHEADLHPYAQRRGGVSLAVDEISDRDRIRRHFGRDLLAQGILPVRLLISNHGRNPVRVSPADVLVMRGREVLDPLPIEQVQRAARPRGLRVGRRAKAEVAAYLRELALDERMLAPGETLQALVFVDASPEQDVPWRFLRLLGSYPAPRMRLQLAVTDLESGERLRFGPFSLHR